MEYTRWISFHCWAEATAGSFHLRAILAPNFQLAHARFERGMRHALASVHCIAGDLSAGIKLDGPLTALGTIELSLETQEPASQ